MAIPKRRRMTVLQKLYEIMDRLADDDGHVVWRMVDKELADYLRLNPDLMDPDADARQFRESVIKQSSLKWNPVQKTLFNPDSWLEVGGGVGVKAEVAVVDDLDQWWLLQMREMSASMQAHTKKTEWYTSRRAAMGNSGRTLGQVERDDFAFRDGDDDSQEEDGDGPDGDDTDGPKLRPVK